MAVQQGARGHLVCVVRATAGVVGDYYGNNRIFILMGLQAKAGWWSTAR